MRGFGTTFDQSPQPGSKASNSAHVALTQGVGESKHYPQPQFQPNRDSSLNLRSSVWVCIVSMQLLEVLQRKERREEGITAAVAPKSPFLMGCVSTQKFGIVLEEQLPEIRAYCKQLL